MLLPQTLIEDGVNTGRVAGRCGASQMGLGPNGTRALGLGPWD
jgi:hypothetical protein